jgi:hypothetical protein
VATCLLAWLAGPAWSQSPAASGAAVGYEVEGGALWVIAPDGSRARVDLPCAAHRALRVETTLYVACGESGLLVLDATEPSHPEVVGARDFGGSVTDVFAVRGQVWASVTRLEARPIGSAPTLAPEPAAPLPTASTPPTAPTIAAATVAPAPTAGQVVEVRAGEVVVDLGSEAGIGRNDRIELFVESEVDLGSGDLATRETRVAVGEVVAVTETRSQVALGINERVPPTALARPTNAELTSDIWLPPRVGDIWEIGFMARPFLSLGTLGVGMVSEVSAGRRFDDPPMAVQIFFDPLGVGLAEEGNIVAWSGNLVVSYDTKAFQVGLGAGWSAVNDEVDRGFDETAAGAEGGIDVEFDRVRSGLSIAQFARLGARDGFNFTALNTFILHEEEFFYGGTRGAFQVPLGTGGTHTWLTVQGGGGRVGYAFGEVGLRVLLAGNGDRGSVFVTPSLGGAYLRGEEETDCEVYDYQTDSMVPGTCVETIEYGGPMVGFGMEWRL